MNFLNQIANFSEANRAQEDLQPKKIKIIRTTKSIPRSIPQFLIRFSSTYFQQSDVNRELVLLQKKNMDALKKQEENKKKDKKDNQQISPKNKNSSSKQSKSSNKKKNDEQKSQKFNQEEESKGSQEKEEKESISQGQRSSVKEEKVSNRSIQESKLTSQPSTQQCLVCFDNQPDSVILECGHGGLCNTCALDIWKKTGECYLCRQTISKIVQIDINQKLGKYKQIVAISNMHEVSNDQEDIVQPISEIIIQQNPQLEVQNNNNQNINQINDQPFEIQLNNELQLAEQQQQVNEQQNDQQIQLQQNQQQIQENQQQQLEEEDKKEEDEQNADRLAIGQQFQNSDENNIEYGSSQKEGEDDDENAGVIEHNDEDDNSESNERQQYQDSTAMRVTLSQYTNYQNPRQVSPSSMFELDAYNSPIIMNSQNDKKKCQSNKNSYPSSQKMLSIEQLQLQLKQVEDIDQYSDLRSVSSYHDQCNTIKNPNFNKSQQNLQKREESTIFELGSNQKIAFDENVNQKQHQDQPLSIINSNLAQPIPIQLCKVNLNGSDKSSLKQKNTSYQDLQNIENNNNSQHINSQNRYLNENKQNINYQDISKQTNKNKEVQECDVEDTQQSTNRSQILQQKSTNQNNSTNIYPENEKEHQYRQSKDQIKIQTLDKFMSKYFVSTNLDDQDTYIPHKQTQYQENMTNENTLKENMSSSNKTFDQVIKLSDGDEQSEEQSDFYVPPIQRLDYTHNKENNQTDYVKDHLKNRGEDVLIIQNQLNEDDTEQPQLSTLRVDKDKELIQFDESEDQFDQN